MADTIAAPPEDEDEALAALDNLAVTLDDNARDERLLARRVREMRTGRAQGRSWQDLLAGERRPGLLELASRALRRLTEASGETRRAVVRGLRAEGAPVAAIAKTFGVSHQRVSSLLRRHA